MQNGYASNAFVCVWQYALEMLHLIHFNPNHLAWILHDDSGSANITPVYRIHHMLITIGSMHVLKKSRKDFSWKVAPCNDKLFFLLTQLCSAVHHIVSPELHTISNTIEASLSWLVLNRMIAFTLWCFGCLKVVRIYQYNTMKSFPYALSTYALCIP